ncbi:Vitamin K epoxide reductase [Herbidospora sp. NEAU-GS84]|uniref:Vitamin K epoxide reductase n=1 Tax=Herbidospora solisilvae TaxID=2696284 RepID=A0A7C9N3X3_9ACTN|nr:vitamin K epoxide reductase family protein [Herbidospora solisilvae]NAS23614.1 Vitamin K epoxide reductase [Herbidospora solisilvae]
MRPWPVDRATARWLLGGGLIGLVAAFVLTVEKIALLKDPSYVPTCSINPLLSCGSIMKTAQAEVFGFPNPLLGIAGFAVVACVGTVLLTGAELPSWFGWSVRGGLLLGLLFVHWLIYQSLYVIGALCPYCMVVWAVMIPMFVYGWSRSPYRILMVTAWYLLIIALILLRFWSLVRM